MKDKRKAELIKKLLKRFVILIVSMLAYLLIGAFMFRELENANQVASQKRLFASLVDFVNEHPCLTNDTLSNFFSAVNDAISMNVISITRDSMVRHADMLWDIPTSFFFTATIVTTIGYGNFVPTTVGGRIFCSFYALVGIPLAGWFLLTVGDALQGCWLRIRKQVHRLTVRVSSQFTRHCIHFTVYSILILVILMIIPGVVFSYTEKWTIHESIYYCFISLSTIGFGDLVAGDRHMDNVWFWIQNIALVVWLLLGLSIMSMALKGMANSQKKGVVRAKTAVRKLAQKATKKHCRRPMSNSNVSMAAPGPSTTGRTTFIEEGKVTEEVQSMR